jgi:hypothetical protein
VQRHLNACVSDAPPVRAISTQRDVCEQSEWFATQTCVPTHMVEVAHLSQLHHNMMAQLQRAIRIAKPTPKSAAGCGDLGLWPKAQAIEQVTFVLVWQSQQVLTQMDKARKQAGADGMMPCSKACSHLPAQRLQHTVYFVHISASSDVANFTAHAIMLAVARCEGVHHLQAARGGACQQ